MLFLIISSISGHSLRQVTLIYIKITYCQQVFFNSFLVELCKKIVKSFYRCTPNELNGSIDLFQQQLSVTRNRWPKTFLISTTYQIRKLGYVSLPYFYSLA